MSTELQSTEPGYSLAGELDPDGPAHYRIRAQGLLGVHWLDMFSGAWVLHEHADSHPHFIILVGIVCDQAALFGVLNHLYNLGLPLISVEWLTDAPERCTQIGSDHRHSPAPEPKRHDRRSNPYSDQVSGPES